MCSLSVTNVCFSQQFGIHDNCYGLPKSHEIQPIYPSLHRELLLSMRCKPEGIIIWVCVRVLRISVTSLRGMHGLTHKN